jgi:amino acid adenylation domain-containing protein
MLLNDFLQDSAQRFPDKTAIVGAIYEPSLQESRKTYQYLDETSNSLAHVLLDRGLDKGDRVCVFLDNSIESAISVFGILKAGGAFVVVNPQTKSQKLVFMLNNCQAKFMIIDRKYSEQISAIDTEVPSVESIILCGPENPSLEPQTSIPVLSMGNILTTVPKNLPQQRCIDIDLAAIIYTSGSTGTPKGVALTHLNMVSAATSITQYLENVASDIVIDVLPLAFDYGLYQLLMVCKFSGMLILEKSFLYPYVVIKKIEQEKITGFPGVPTTFAMLLQIKDLKQHNFDSIRYVTNTAAALPPKHILQLKEVFPKAKIYSMYGVTECKRVTYLPPEDLDKRPTSVGKGMPNEEVYVVKEDGELAEPDEIGELVVRGSNVMKGYWDMPEETDKVLRPGRYPWEKVLYTGDLFKMDEDGYLYFVARKDDIIKSRGEKVSPKEIENVLYDIDGVLEAAIIGVSDEVLGEIIKAIIVPKDGTILSEKEVLRHCQQNLESFMVPKIIEFASSLPKTLTGKIRKAELR